MAGRQNQQFLDRPWPVRRRRVAPETQPVPTDLVENWLEGLSWNRSLGPESSLNVEVDGSFSSACEDFGQRAAIKNCQSETRIVPSQNDRLATRSLGESQSVGPDDESSWRET